jgi:uncharacterized repeat protein (TIGR03803 family)
MNALVLRPGLIWTALVWFGWGPMPAAAGVLQTLHLFNGNDGLAPQSTLTVGPDGALYGTTTFGGAHGQGTLFKISTNGGFVSLAAFDGGTNGANPFGRLMLSAGALYGTAANGGPFGHGTVFRYDTNLTVLTEFPDHALHGNYPYAGLCDGLDNEFFGVAGGGGANGQGLVYKIYFSDGTETPLHSFAGNDGQSPYGALWLHPTNGYFYGTTVGGGTNGGFGTVFRISFGGLFQSLFSFGNTNGAHPWAGLILGRGGVLYGTTVDGGPHGAGTVFSVSNDVVRMVAAFDHTNGANPYAELTAAPDGTLYGVARQGGGENRGTIYRLTTNGTLSALKSFRYDRGAAPHGGLVLGGDGHLYGTTSDGGTGAGTIFRFILDPPAPTLQSVAAEDAALKTTWNVVAGGEYQLQSTTNLAAPNWVNTGPPVTATNATLLVSDAISSDPPQRFYRLALLP